MIRQARKRLDADDIVNVAVDQLHHLACQEPSLTCLVTAGNNRRSILRQIPYISRRIKVFALLELCNCRAPQPVDQLNARISEHRRALLESKVLYLEIRIVEAIAEEIDQIRHNRLGAFAFEKLRQMVIGRRKELNQNLADNTDTRFFLVRNRNVVKVADHRAADLFKTGMTQVFGRNEINTDFLPFPVNPVCRALFLLIRTHPVDTFHHDITELRRIAETDCKIRCNLEARIFFETAQVNRDDRNLRHIGLLQCTANKSDIV